MNIALIEQNTPTKGVIYAPALKLLYFAEAKSGSFKQEFHQKLQESAPQRIYSQIADPSQPLSLVESRSHGSKALENYIQERKLTISSRVASGSSLKICRLRRVRRIYTHEWPQQWNGMQQLEMLLSLLWQTKNTHI